MSCIVNTRKTYLFLLCFYDVPNSRDKLIQKSANWFGSDNYPKKRTLELHTIIRDN